MNRSPVGRAAQFYRLGYDLPEAVFAEAVAWAKECATFNIGGLANHLESCGVPRYVDLRCGRADVSGPMALQMIGHWARTGCVRRAGTRLYRWAHT